MVLNDRLAILRLDSDYGGKTGLYLEKIMHHKGWEGIIYNLQYAFEEMYNISKITDLEEAIKALKVAGNSFRYFPRLTV